MLKEADGSVAAERDDTRVVQEMVRDRFKVAGGDPGMENSWQVTGLGHGAFAEQNWIPVTELKPPKQRGECVHRTGFGLPETTPIDFVPGEPPPAWHAPAREEQKVERVQGEDVH